MKIEVDDVKAFSNLLDTVSPMVVSDEFFLVFAPEKFAVNLVNAYRTGLVNLDLDSKYFAGYEVEEKHIIPLPYNGFMSHLKMYESFKTMKMEYDIENNRINFYAAEKKRRKRSHMQTITPLQEYSDSHEVKVSYTTMFSINTKEFDTALKECKLFNEGWVDFKITDTEFVVKSESDEKSGGTETAWSLVDDVKALMSNNLEIAFRTEMLTDITSKLKNIETAMISLGDYVPIKISVTFKFGSLIYYIVPNDPGAK